MRWERFLLLVTLMTLFQLYHLQWRQWGAITYRDVFAHCPTKWPCMRSERISFWHLRSQLTPVNTSVAQIEAKDDDSGVLYYALQPALVCSLLGSLIVSSCSDIMPGTIYDTCLSLQNPYFRLENMYKPNILVNKTLDYDVIQQVTLTLYVQVCKDRQVWSPEQA